MPLQISHSPNFNNCLAFSDYFQQQNRTVVLLTHYRETNPYYDSINSMILEKLINIDLQAIEWQDMTDRLKSFFVDLNWELNAQFRTTSGFEKGVSLFLAVAEGDKLCYTSFGRYLCGLLGKDNEKSFSEDWSGFRVKTAEQLGLLGSLEQDIIVKPLLTDVTDDQHFIVCSSDALQDVNVSTLNVFNVQTVFSERLASQEFSHCIFFHSDIIRPAKISRSKTLKVRITITVMLLSLIFSVYYLFKGENTIEDRLHITREQFLLGVRNIDLLKIQELIPLDYGILLVPQRNIELFVEWESALPFKVTLPPQYDMRQIFLASDNKLYSYDKRDKKNNWSVDLPQRITAVDILDANLMIISTVNNENYCLKRDTGDIIWSRVGRKVTANPQKIVHKPVQISLEMDRRLNSSIILLPDIKSLTLMNILNGDTLYYYEAETSIDFISDFDLIDKSIYMIKGNRLFKVRFDVRN